MILIITGSNDVTADLVENKLNEMKVHTVRLNTEEFPSLSKISVEYDNNSLLGNLHINNSRVSLDDISTIWYRKPNPPRISPEVKQPEARSFALEESRATLRGVYRLLKDSFWVSHPDDIRRANDKLHQLSLAKSLGFIIPRTLVTNDPEKAASFCATNSSPKIIKPIKAGMIEYPSGKVELIYTSLVTSTDLENINQVSYAPCMLQDYISKQYEIRLTIIGTRVFCVGIDSQKADDSKLDWRKNNCQSVGYFETTVPESIIKKCFEFMRHYNLKFSAFDFVKSLDDTYVFLENNPNGQWAWLDLEIGNGMIKYMAEFLTSGGKS